MKVPAGASSRLVSLPEREAREKLKEAGNGNVMKCHVKGG